MGRAIVAVIVGYVAMFIISLICFVAAFVLTPADFQFVPGGFESTTTFIGIAIVITLVTAIIGGLICASIARGGKATLVLAIVVFVLGMLLAIPAVTKRNANLHLIRTADTTKMEVVNNGYWPVWVPFAFPVVGAIGVVVGGKLKRR
jgi:hypothetical protein